jgi:hypothetical protein
MQGYLLPLINGTSIIGMIMYVFPVSISVSILYPFLLYNKYLIPYQRRHHRRFRRPPKHALPLHPPLWVSLPNPLALFSLSAPPYPVRLSLRILLRRIHRTLSTRYHSVMSGGPHRCKTGSILPCDYGVEFDWDADCGSVAWVWRGKLPRIDLFCRMYTSFVRGFEMRLTCSRVVH